MAVYNKAPYLHESIDSVLNQDMEDFEVVCVNAASTDNSLQILDEYASRDLRVTVYSTAYSKIPAITKNFGINRTRGEYVFNLDADDYLRPDTLDQLYAKAKETGADAVVPDLQTVNEHGEKISPFISGVKGNRNMLLTNREAVTESLDWTIHGFALWRGDLIRRVRFEEFGSHSDEYSTRVLFLNCNRVGFCEGIYFHRINNQSLTGKISLQLYDRPEAIRRLASFLESQLFDENDVDSHYFSAFEDCCFMLSNRKQLTPSDAVEAERRIRSVYNQIDMRRVRKSIFASPPGRAALWRPKGKVKKYIFALLTLSGWSFLKRIPLKYLFSG